MTEPATIVIEEGQEAPVIKPTVEALSESGLKVNEVELAKKHGLTEEKKSEEVKKPEETKPEEVKDEPKKEEKKPEETKAPVLTPEEQELENLKAYNKNEKALYWQQKKERRKRQDAEVERDKTLIENRLLKERLAAQASPKSETQKKDDLLNLDDDAIDRVLAGDKPADNKDVNPEDKPLTEQRLKEIQGEDRKKQTELQDKASRLNERLNEQAKEAKAIYPDFEKVIDLAEEVMKNTETVFPANPKMQAKVQRLVKNWYITAATALDKESDENAADLIYEIGQLHPNYKPGEQAAGNGKDSASKADDKKISKMMDNASKRSTSASLSGGGKRTVTVEELTLEQALRLPSEEYRKLPQHVKDRFLGKTR